MRQSQVVYPIAVVDSHELTRAGLEMIIGSAGYDVKTFKEKNSFESSLHTQLFSCVVLTDELAVTPHLVKQIHRWKQHQPQLQILVISATLNQRTIQLLLRGGVRGFLSLSDDLTNTLPEALDVIKQSPYVSQRVGAALINRRQNASDLRLKETHIDVLNLIAKGYSNDELAQTLGYHRRTVYRIRTQLRQALKVRNNEQLVDEARKRGLIDYL